jgi:hypothetical protein
MMKKLAFFGLLVFLCPFAMGAVTASQVTQSQAEPSNALNLSTDMLGLHGPFSLTTIYSKTFGLILEGKYTQLLDQTNAISVELDGGKAERRIGATWGHILTPNQRFKITAERLSQKRDFSFDSGSVSTWVYQNALGGSYEYLFSHNLIKSIDLNAFYSKASSKNLPYKDYMQGGSLFRNYRRIAGATDKSISTGINLSPVKPTLIGLQLNYDNVKYNTRYEKSLSDDSGLGATITLHQLVNKRIQFSLLASDRKPYKDYQGEVDWLVHSVPGNQLQLGLVGERIDGSHGLPNDNRVGLKLSYSWGGDNSAQPATFSDPAPNNDTAGLRDWTATPAVHMQQVLAIKDQKTVKVTPTPSPSKKKDDTFYFNNKKYGDPIQVTEAIGTPIGDELNFNNESDPRKTPLFINLKYKPQAQESITFKQDPNNPLPKDLHLVVKPWGNHYNYDVKITGTPSQTAYEKYPDHKITFNIIATRDYDGATATAKFEIILTSTKPGITINPKIEEGAFIANNKPTDKVELATIQVHQGTIDPDSIKVPNIKAKHNLDLIGASECKGKTKCEIYLQSNGIDADKATYKQERFSITVNDTEGGSATKSFDLVIKGAPVVNPDKSDLGSASVSTGGKIAAVTDLASHFENPMKSGDIDNTKFVLKDDRGTDVTSTYGIAVDNNGSLYSKAPMPSTTPAGQVEIYVYAGNAIGTSTSHATYHLTVVSNAPKIKFVDNATFQAGDKQGSFTVVDITRSNGTINPDDIVVSRDSGQPLSYHCLTKEIDLSADQKTAHIKIKINNGDHVLYPGTSTYTVSYDGVSLQHAFKVAVASRIGMTVIYPHLTLKDRQHLNHLAIARIYINDDVQLAVPVDVEPIGSGPDLDTLSIKYNTHESQGKTGRTLYLELNSDHVKKGPGSKDHMYNITVYGANGEVITKRFMLTIN